MRAAGGRERSSPKIAPRCGETGPPPERKTEWKKWGSEVSEEEIQRENDNTSDSTSTQSCHI